LRSKKNQSQKLNIKGEVSPQLRPIVNMTKRRHIYNCSPLPPVGGHPATPQGAKEGQKNDESDIRAAPCRPYTHAHILYTSIARSLPFDNPCTDSPAWPLSSSLPHTRK
jgi:hypothetical protein